MKDAYGHLFIILICRRICHLFILTQVIRIYNMAKYYYNINVPHTTVCMYAFFRVFLYIQILQSFTHLLATKMYSIIVKYTTYKKYNFKHKNIGSFTTVKLTRKQINLFMLFSYFNSIFKNVERFGIYY